MKVAYYAGGVKDPAGFKDTPRVGVHMDCLILTRFAEKVSFYHQRATAYRLKGPPFDLDRLY